MANCKSTLNTVTITIFSSSSEPLFIICTRCNAKLPNFESFLPENRQQTSYKAFSNPDTNFEKHLWFRSPEIPALNLDVSFHGNDYARLVFGERLLRPVPLFLPVAFYDTHRRKLSSLAQHARK